MSSTFTPPKVQPPERGIPLLLLSRSTMSVPSQSATERLLARRMPSSANSSASVSSTTFSRSPSPSPAPASTQPPISPVRSFPTSTLPSAAPSPSRAVFRIRSPSWSRSIPRLSALDSINTMSINASSSSPLRLSSRAASTGSVSISILPRGPSSATSPVLQNAPRSTSSSTAMRTENFDRVRSSTRFPGIPSHP